MILIKENRGLCFQSKFILIIAGYLISAHICYAQSFYSENHITTSFEGEIGKTKRKHIDFDDTLTLGDFKVDFVKNSYIILHNKYHYMPFDYTTSVACFRLMHNTNLRKTPKYGLTEINVLSSESTYLNLLAKRNITLNISYQNNNFMTEVDLIANRYETVYATTQFGVSVFLQYRFSSHWSMGLWGTMYNQNPYFNMAAFPFVEASSFGGWVKYEDRRVGLKLGSRSYYDTFQRQWKWEPIITPSVKIGKKVTLEVPVGSMVQKSMEKILKKGKYNGGIIMPNFN